MAHDPGSRGSVQVVPGVVTDEFPEYLGDYFGTDTEASHLYHSQSFPATSSRDFAQVNSAVTRKTTTDNGVTRVRTDHGVVFQDHGVEDDLVDGIHRVPSKSNASIEQSTDSRNSTWKKERSSRLGFKCRRGAARRESGQRVTARTVEGKRISGMRGSQSHAAPGQRRFGSVLDSHVESDECSSGQFRDQLLSELNVVGGKMASEHESMLCLVMQRCEWFEREFGLITRELDRICKEQGLPAPEQAVVPSRLSINHIKVSAPPPRIKPKPKRFSAQLEGTSYKELLARGSVMSCISTGTHRSSVTSELYEDQVVGGTRGSMLSVLSDAAAMDTEDTQNTIAPPPPREHNPPPPVMEQEEMTEENSVANTTLAANPPQPTLKAAEIIAVTPGTAQRGSNESVDAMRLELTEPSQAGRGGSLELPSAPGLPTVSITITPAVQFAKQAGGVDNRDSGSSLLPTPKATPGRVSWLEDDREEKPQRVSSSLEELNQSGDGAFLVCKIWQDKVNRMRPSQRPSQRSRGSGYRDSNAGLIHSPFSRPLDDDSDSDQDQRLIDHRLYRTNSNLSHGEAKQYEKRRWQIRLRRLVVSPESFMRTFVDFLGAVFVSYEAVVIPLHFFVHDSTFLKAMEWPIAIFWTCDIFLSMLTSFTRPNGKLERRVSRVMLHYMKSWFCFDLVMVLLSWAEMVILDYAGLALFARVVKSIRIVRTVRIVRLAKLHRFPEIVKGVAYYFRSDICVIIMSMVRLIIFVIWINHVCCCCWFGIGANTGSDNWVSFLNMDDKEIWYQYWTSFHWSLAQFAAGSVEVIPRNLFERIYAVLALLFAYVTSAWIVSSITSSMTRLEIAAAQESQKMMTLKQYLFDNNISRQVALRVQRNAQHELAKKTKNRDENAVELLAMISEPLRMDMHFELNSKWLCFHPLFRNYCVVSQGLMRKVCHQALSRLDLSKGDILFTDDEPCVQPSMYFVLSGKMSFLHGLASTARGVNVGHWACEATLWTDWVHCGDMRAIDDSTTLLVLDAVVFQFVVASSENQWIPCFKYASRFVNHLNSADETKLTDLCDADMDLESWVAEACPDAQLNQGSAVAGFKGLKRSKPKRLSNLLLFPRMGGGASMHSVPSM